jgi:hypothetical protein
MTASGAAAGTSFPQFPALPGRLAEQKLDLGVEGAKLRRGPALQSLVQRRIETEQDRFPFRHPSPLSPRTGYRC